MFNLRILVSTVFCLFLVNCDDVRNRGSRDEASSKIMYPNDFLLAQGHQHHSPGYHSHQGFPPESHRTSNYHGEKIGHEYDPDWEEEIQFADSYNNASTQIPLDFIHNINQFNVSDLLLNFVEGDTEYDEPFILNRFADDGARNAATMPKAAGCIPELKTITVATSNDPSILYIPQCTRTERCGGCCSHTLLSCQPTEIETLTYKVMKTQYTGGKKLKLLGKEVVVVEKHISCKCDCKAKEEDCNKYQEYRKSECRCACTNIDEEKKCYKNTSKKLWDPDLCACQCRDVTPCSTGYSFDQIECRCMPTPMKRRFANYDRRGYVPEAPPVSPLVEDDY